MNRINFLNLTANQKFAIEEISPLLNVTADEKSDIKVEIAKGDALSVTGDKKNVKITYRRENELYRALSYLPAFLKDGKEIKESGAYKMLCYMADNSRNAVFSMDGVKRMIKYLALMGYDSMMLYTEDTYELPGYKYFGHMRGKFTEKELKEIDDYAFAFGIEMIPCIQTLAHMTTALRWPDFNGYKDSPDILMVGDDRTYKFVESALKQWKKCFRSDKINIGMDEAHLIGCGEYLKKNGYRKPADIMLEHLNKVTKMCHELGYKPMMWSDMFFRMANHGTYYISEGEIAKEVIDKVPEGLDLVYWDYYSMNRDLFCHMVDCHNKFNNPIVFAGGAWKWYGFGAHNKFSLKSTKMQLDECKNRGIDRIIVTSWGDNGADASQFSALASMLYFAERGYSDSVDEKHMEKRALQCFGTGFEALLGFDLPDELEGLTPEKISRPKNPSKYMLYNDPFERFFDCHVKGDAKESFKKNADKLAVLSKDKNFGYAFKTLELLCRILTVKCDMGIRLYDAYQKKDMKALANIADVEIPDVIKNIDKFITAFRKQWYKENKTFGFTTQEIRLGGLKERMKSAKIRLDAFVKGDIDRIEELEYEALPMNPKNDGDYTNFNLWDKMVGAGIV